MMSTEAVLKGLGLGQNVATNLSPLVVFCIRDLTSMAAGVAFAAYEGRSLDVHAKQFRLLADIANNIGYALELAAPAWPNAFLTLVCLASLSRAITGVAGGATRAALTQHFARQGNAADVAAKEGSQETATTIVGMLLGLVLTTATSGRPLFTWLLFAVLTLLHVFANVKAVRALHLTSLNPTRTELLVEEFLRQGQVLRPEDLAATETLLVPPLRSLLLGDKLRFGARLHDMVAVTPGGRQTLLTRAKDMKYIVCLADGRAVVLLRVDADPADHLRAFVHGLVLRHYATCTRDCQEALDAHNWMHVQFQQFLQGLVDAGWDVKRVMLVTSPYTYQVVSRKED
ncbi:hypothetical protein WJX72_002605 [[Myrmecia] bisecta]|uniref:Uncharacterized protein n=1 Tax=[Myrmecia] bisecta TaxID=41462 RepID=A0AAW1QF10_9CHLO